MTNFKQWLAEVETGAPQTLYHVTMIRKLGAIRSHGLIPNQRSAFTAGVYPEYSKNKVFLTDERGLNFWKEKVEHAEFDQFDDPKGIAVLTVNVAGLNLQVDELGSKDSRGQSFFVAEPIPASRITSVQEFPTE